MHKLLRLAYLSLSVVIILLLIPASLFKHAGDGSSGVPDDDEPDPLDNRNLKTVEDFKKELGHQLPPHRFPQIYTTFKEASELQRAGKDSSARAHYTKLRSLPREDGSKLDLLEYSEVLKHNWDRLT